MTLTIRADIVGPRLRAARVAANLTQEEAARALGLARTTLLAIEAGKRLPKAEELRAFSDLYSVRAGELLTRSRQPLDLEVKYRSSGMRRADRSDNSETENVLETAKAQASKLLNRLAASALELEGLLELSRSRAEYPSWSVNSDQSVEEQAEDAALMFRQRLGVGFGPISNLKALLELEFGIWVFERPLHSSISGACAFHKEYGGFILLNSNHWPERRQQTAGHEAGHGMARPGEPAVLINTDEFVDREDRFCDVFARALLMPAAVVRRKAVEIKGMGKLTVRHLLWLAAYFHVSIEAMGRRMESLALIPRGTYDSLKNRKIGRSHLEQVVRESEMAFAPSGFTPKLLFLASEAYSRGLLSEQQIAEKLELDLPSVRSALEGVTNANESGASLASS